MFKDIRLKKTTNNSSAHNGGGNVKPSSGTSPTKHILTPLASTSSTPNARNDSRKSMDSESSSDLYSDVLPTIKGTVTHEWGRSSAKKNASIIKLNNKDGTPLASPIKLSATVSPPDILTEDFEGERENNQANDIIDQKRKTNRSARIFSNDQFLNIDILSPEDKKLIEKINNGKIYDSPEKNLEIVNAAQPKTKFLLYGSPISTNSITTTEDDNYTVSFSKTEKHDINQPHKSHTCKSSNNKNDKNRSRSVSASESINSESSDVSTSSQFSFQFNGRNNSVKYYSKNNPKESEMIYFDDVYQRDNDMDEEVDNDDIFDEEDDDEEFGNGFSTIAHISDEAEDDIQSNGGVSNISQEYNWDNAETADENILKKSTTANTLPCQGEDTAKGNNFDNCISDGNDEEEDDELLTPVAHENGKMIKNFNDLFAISDENEESVIGADQDSTPKVKKNKQLIDSTVSSYKDLFDLSEPDDLDETQNSSANNELKDYTNDYSLENLIEEMDESLNVYLNDKKSEPINHSSPSRVTSPLFSSFQSPKPQSKKNFIYSQLYGDNNISTMQNTSSTPPYAIQSSKSALATLPPRNILKYHDLNMNLDSNIPKRMGELFFIDEEGEEDILSKHGAVSDYNEDDDLILDEINEIPEDYEENEDLPPSGNGNRLLFPQRQISSKNSNTDNNNNSTSKTSEKIFNISNNIPAASITKSNGSIPQHNNKSQKYYKFFNKGNSLVARNDKPQNNKVSIKTKTITFFKKQNYLDSINTSSDNSNSSYRNTSNNRTISRTPPRNLASDVDLSPIQERRGSIEE